jgi:hypothetical protein
MSAKYIIRLPIILIIYCAYLFRKYLYHLNFESLLSWALMIITGNMLIIIFYCVTCPKDTAHF